MDLITALRAYLIEDNCFFGVEEHVSELDGATYFMVWDCDTGYQRVIMPVEQWSRFTLPIYAGFTMGIAIREAAQMELPGYHLATLATWQLDDAVDMTLDELHELVGQYGQAIDVWQFDTRGR